MNVVIVNCFDTLEHRVDLLHDIFIKEGHLVKVLTSNYRHFEKVQRTDNKKDFVFFCAKPYKKNLSYSRIMSHIELSRHIFEHLEKIECPDLVWILLPPNSFAKDAARYKKSHPSVKLIFDLLDLWPETLPVGSIKKVFPFTIWRNLRNRNIRIADYIVTECDLYRHKLNEILQDKPTSTLYLARPLIQYKPILNLPEDKMSLCYLGSINNIIDIDKICEIIKTIVKERPVEIHIIGDGERKDVLIKKAKQAGADVVFHGKVFMRDEKQLIFDSCHYGLNIMKPTVCVGLTMKSMDYLEFGLPMINNIQGDTWNNIEKENMGLNVKPGFALSKPYDMSMRYRARRYFERELTTDVFENKLIKILNEI